jgi:hypothetical protein
MPVDKAPKRQAWTAQQKWFAVELKRKFPDKIDDIIIAVKAKFDRDVSSSTLCAWLKPETAAKIEQLANASGQSDTKRRRICDYPKLEHALFLWYRGHETRGAAVTGDVLTQKAKELALIPELEVSEALYALRVGSRISRSAMASALRSGMARPARLQKPASSSLRPSSKAAGGVAGQGRRE